MLGTYIMYIHTLILNT